VPDVLAGRKPAEPLVLRANVGDVVGITLRSALVDQSENKFYTKVGIHTHLVQYDVQSSDGAVGGLNYETSVRPSLRWDAAAGKLVPLSDQIGEFEEQVHYRWWCDVELGTVYFHDHSRLRESLPHGLFGATIVEPEGANYTNPVTGKPLYHSRDGRVTGSVGGHGLAVADIWVDKGNSTGRSFREFVTLFDDSNQIHDKYTINLRMRAAGAPSGKAPRQRDRTAPLRRS